MQRIGLIGCGRIGKVHAISIARNPHSSLAVVFDPSADTARAVAEQYGCRIAPTAEALWNDAGVDAVLIASPTDLHREQYLGAARAGKAVFGEKPIDNNLQAANATVRALRETAAPVMIGFNRRFDPDHFALRQEVVRGGIGRIQSMQLASRGPNGVPTPQYLRGSGGFYRDKCVHFLDLIRWIGRQEPVAIAAMGSVIADASVGEAGDVDTAAIIVRLADGALAHIDNARRAVQGYDDRIEVFGTGGVIESSRMRRGNVTHITANGMSLGALPANSHERYGESYARAFDAFVDHLRGEAVEIPTIEDGLMAQVMAEAATLSAQESRIVQVREILDQL